MGNERQDIIKEKAKIFFENQQYVEDLNITLNSTIGIDMLNEKSIMVTGATGLIGSFLVDTLLLNNKDNHANTHIYALGRNANRMKDRFCQNEGQNLTLVEQDVTMPIQVDFSIDYIVHAAGNAYPAAFKMDPVGTIESNIQGTLNLLNYGLIHECKRLLFVSSGEVYGNGDLSLEAFGENDYGYIDCLKSRSCYPLSKKMAENLCISYTKQYGLETVIVRPPHTYGPTSTIKDNRASTQFIQNGVKNKDIILKSDGKQFRSYCYVSDCVSAILSVLLRGSCGSAYNIANKNSRVTIADFARNVANYTGKRVIQNCNNEVTVNDETPIVKQVLDSEKIEKLGWIPKFSIREGIEHAIRASSY